MLNNYIYRKKLCLFDNNKNKKQKIFVENYLKIQIKTFKNAFILYCSPLVPHLFPPVFPPYVTVIYIYILYRGYIYIYKHIT
jgi:hypothetical protein